MAGKREAPAEEGRRDGVTEQKLTLDHILNDDLVGLPPQRTSAPAPDDRVRQAFEEINLFVDAHGRVPRLPDGSGGNIPVSERTLAIRLKQLASRPARAAALSHFDRHGLLAGAAAGNVPVSGKEPETLDDIFAMDDGLLSSGHDGIFDLRYVGPGGLASHDFVADRRSCDDFSAFEPLFDLCARELASGKRKTIRFANEQEIAAGDFFVLNGVTAYVAELNDPHLRNGRRDARLRVIFDNGTESDMLLRSLARQLYNDNDGRRITSPEAGPLFGDEVSEGDVRTGCVYIAASLSKNPAVAGLMDLYKLGVTTGKAERRIKRAERDPTFLMAPAKLLKTYEIYNWPPGHVEALLHAFFAEVCMDLEVQDRFGRAIRPREWFIVPLEILDRAVRLLMDGTIGNYRYDRERGEIIPV